ncbi:PEP-CTERM sorting domain-containing protein [Aliiglaciecola lipolytica]|uniref:Ice-binding protein C-terminal domain-containing protein n=1 Tax=Aliiglaciecola lipolytica E3 TaxID=1127673 RepID=K6YXV7_9ALTE|nr:PEP-CTERM sorting domain-containing protein [Aliiglaciecola lipolytica]GAC16070.1 hypothetical protein GLIP_3456 [Aliiglaciecola lipolytica E3]
MFKSIKITILLSALLTMSAAWAAPYSVLWWDSTPTYGSQAADPLRQEMSDYLTNYNGGGVYNSTYVSSEVPGTLAVELNNNSYDVIVFDATSGSQKFDAADLAAVQNHYATKSNLLLDGSLYIRSINYNATTDFPGPNSALGGLTINEINQLAVRGGGIMIGTDHNCCQVDANQILGSVVPGAMFSGYTIPSTDGVFYGGDLLNDEVAIAAVDVFNHWDSVPSQAIAETGDFVDFFGNNITLYSQVDVADKPGGGPRFSYISSSWQPGDGETDIDDDTPGGDSNNPGAIPEPSTTALLFAGLVLIGLRMRQHS